MKMAAIVESVDFLSSSNWACYSKFNYITEDSDLIPDMEGYLDPRVEFVDLVI